MDGSAAAASRPLHLWIVGILSLIWNAFGAFDYVMTSIRNAQYLAQFPPEMLQMIDAFPVWVTGAWALGVWGAVAGSLLLLLRSRHAFAAFALSLLGLAASTAYQFGLELPAAMKSTGMTAMTVAIWIVAVFLVLYSFRLRRQSTLR